NTTLKKIIQYNNSQNKIEAPDFRSGEPIQKRLRQEFDQIPDATYLGGRRGGYEDRIKRISDLLPSDTVGQALATFHGDPVVAYNQKSNIWISDSLYSKYFSEQTTAKHIIFCYSLLKAVENRKQNLKQEASKSNKKLTDNDKKLLIFFQKRGSILLLSSAIAASLESILAESIDQKFSLEFKENYSPQQAISAWKDVVDVCSLYVKKLNPALESVLKSADITADAISKFATDIEAIITLLSETGPETNSINSKFTQFSEKVKI
ncbi:MAG: AIPR family protein, partial [Jaaginema sp. PMC 1078.18]|nr:AIPR family protein [Jaaginema sp. PMC 1078.18]